MNLLLDAGADPNHYGRRVVARARTSLPLCMALYSRKSTSLAIAGTLLRHGARVIRVSSDGRNSAWHCIGGRIDLAAKAELLVRYGAPMDVRSRRGQPALLHLVTETWDEAIEPLLANGVEVDARGRNGETALMVASGRGQLWTVQQLLAAGADVTLRDNAGRSALDYLAKKKPRSVAPRPGSGREPAQVC